jgi:hypothetical protein
MSTHENRHQPAAGNFFVERISGDEKQAELSLEEGRCRRVGTVM